MPSHKYLLAVQRKAEFGTTTFWFSLTLQDSDYLFILTVFPQFPVMLNDILSTSVLAFDKWIFLVPAEK